MIKTIELESGKKINLSDSASFLLVYKNRFKREPLQDLAQLVDSITENDEGKLKSTFDLLKNLELEVLYNVTWCLAYITKNEEQIPLKVEDFYNKFDDFKPIDYISEILTLALRSLSVDFDIEVDEEGVTEKN